MNKKQVASNASRNGSARSARAAARTTNQGWGRRQKTPAQAGHARENPDSTVKTSRRANRNSVSDFKPGKVPGGRP